MVKISFIHLNFKELPFVQVRSYYVLRGRDWNVYYQLTFTCSKSTKGTRKSYKICSKLAIIKRPERRHSGIFTFNFEHISHPFIVFLLLALNKEMLAGLCHQNFR